MIEAVLRVHGMRGLVALVAGVVLTGLVAPAIAAEGAAAEGGHGEGAHGVDWQAWTAGNEVNNTASLQRGAANFVNYCMGCHSLKYMRFERMAKDLEIPAEQLGANLILTGAKPADYMLSTFPAADGEAWFGRARRTCR
jgi:ubiquinol-cytochrome c reductase cytochrome c1 subunit